MKFNLIIAAILLGLSPLAGADFRTVQQGYEVSLAEVRLPRAEGGTIAFRECAKCNYQTRRVSPETRWLINGRAVSLEKFRAAVARVQNRKREAVSILHHLEENRVTEVSVYL